MEFPPGDLEGDEEEVEEKKEAEPRGYVFGRSSALALMPWVTSAYNANAVSRQ